MHRKKFHTLVDQRNKAESKLSHRTCNEYSIVRRMVVVLFLVLDVEVAPGKEVVSSQPRTARVVSVLVLDVVYISSNKTKRVRR